MGHIKDVFFKDSPENLEELTESVRTTITGISKENVARVADEAKRRLTFAQPETGVMSKSSDYGGEEVRRSLTFVL